MDVLSVSELKNYDSYVRLSQTQAKSFSRAAQDSVTPGVFLSHSHQDKELVEFAKTFLASHGFAVFVDWQDGTMPTTIGPDTASMLRAKIEANRKFVLLATDNALASKWVPWELGCADGIKSSKHIAVLAIRPDGGTWKGNEYMGIYPIIERDGIRDPGASTLISIKSWLMR